MLRDRDACGVVVESGDRIDRIGRKLPCFRDWNAGAPQQPRAVLRRGRSHHDDRLGTTRQQRRQHAILPRGVITRLCKNHGIAKRLQFVGQALHGIGENRVRNRRHQYADGIGAGTGQRASQPVRHVTQFAHRRLDLGAGLRRNHFRQPHHAADSDG